MTFQVKTIKFLFLAVVLGLFGIVVLFSTLFVVDEREQVIITQFGEPVGEPIKEPGLKWKLPFIQDVRRFDKRLLTWDGDVNQIPTLGREFIIIDTTARWQITDPLLFLKSVRNEVGAQSRLDDIIDSVVRDKISNTELEEIVRSKDYEFNPSDLPDALIEREDVDLKKKPTKGREELTREILEEAQKTMPQYGVELVDVRIKRINYIDSVRKKVEERMISERQRIAEQFRSEGQGRSAEIDGQTEKKVREILSGAKREVEVIKGEADAEATRIYGQAFGEDSEFYSFFKTLESYEGIIGKNTVLMLPIESELYQYLASETALTPAISEEE